MEIDKLKTDWLQDPCWDLEDTEGFEAHREELLAFRHEQERRWQVKRQADLAALAANAGCPPDPALGARLWSLDATRAAQADQAHRLLCHYLRVTAADADGQAELGHLVDCLIEAAHAKTLHYLLIEAHRLQPQEEA